MLLMFIFQILATAQTIIGEAHPTATTGNWVIFCCLWAPPGLPLTNWAGFWLTTWDGEFFPTQNYELLKLWQNPGTETKKSWKMSQSSLDSISKLSNLTLNIQNDHLRIQFKPPRTIQHVLGCSIILVVVSKKQSKKRRRSVHSVQNRLLPHSWSQNHPSWKQRWKQLAAVPCNRNKCRRFDWKTSGAWFKVLLPVLT